MLRAAVPKLRVPGVLGARYASRSTARTCSNDDLFLGLDSSTQGLKATVVNGAIETVATVAINFDSDLSQYGTTNGVFDVGDGVVEAPTKMFVDALDVVMRKISTKVDPAKILAVSGSGQQHGSVFWHDGAEAELRSIDAGAESIADAFGDEDRMLSYSRSPIWMDTSTTAQCEALEAALGGPQAVSDLTGSRAYERFTGNQIMKLAQQQPGMYRTTGQISLISSFMCSLLLGKWAPIDTSDGAGMNMMDLRAQAWSPAALGAIADGLADKLLAVVPGHTRVGTVAEYITASYGINPGCAVIAWSGDNPNSVAGLGLNNPGDIGLSLGTSDTIFSICPAADSKPGLEGHFFVNPVDPQSHMAMLCYKNGSLARETVCEQVTGTAGDWAKFGELIDATAPGNGGNLGFYIMSPEIIPKIPDTGVRRFDASGAAVETFAPQVEARAILEGQMLSYRLHSTKMGLTPETITATGGASQNPHITQIMANVFGTVVQAASQPDSASLGAACRALHGWECHQANGYVPFAEVAPELQDHTTVAEPDAAAHAVYTELLEAYAAREAEITSA
mmetsp:Transcript_20335/g.52738  ORF Transcript_20335/g.52738 Transcript_20335/m.52738 type:complete len:564 (+) Transcript_20335:35-1726(+)|eukprot:CAMPEP_0182921652 /NCGR_PEP_ID=MMETSP0105_2-20130417/4273_1 /TAXON_ID=81532 ORGANISM="Acanthoeca-like sp., Strain 10tr" /NCGR_SAMPLE_ID=MMETSP0105_2 /ASSEMBLY_ACC=CAM_ASM_000205 /LENGTH=563 /DNA_ID=CAMNT_0025059185 /DNA_START=19 /DNA_END=1710 /DNA_ORIENTATION=-